MASLFSKVDLNKLWHDVQNEDNVIFAKFGKDLFNISKDIGHNTKWPRFFGLPGMLNEAEPETILKLFQCYVSGMCGLRTSDIQESRAAARKPRDAASVLFR